MIFENRAEAGRALGDAVAALNFPNPLVVALPRGGIPVAVEVARRLDAAVAVLAVRKLGAPENPEYGVGAYAQGGFSLVDAPRAQEAGITAEDLEWSMARARREVEALERTFRGYSLPARLDPHTCLVVDDGVATGVTAHLALDLLRRLGAATTVLAVPICSPDTAAALELEGHRVVTLERPDPFFAVGGFYEDFSQVSDEQACSLLKTLEPSHDYQH